MFCLIEAIESIHASGVIHGSICPQNILLQNYSSSFKVHLTNFSHSSELQREFSNYINNPLHLEQDLKYISPEQTGRINIDIDYRSDFYSLGAVFYQLVCHRPPFEYEDKMELLYSHVARIPKEPSLISDTPNALSNIVIQLLQKSIDDRYQSLFGLKYDLELAFMLDDPKKTFSLRTKDVSSKFNVCQKLFGRESEVAKILSLFDKVQCGVVPRTLLKIFGTSGIGKTSLICELKKPLTETKGYFFSGKFDQFKKNIPYAPFLHVFRKLISMILSESPQIIAEWKRSLLESLGGKGKLLVDLIPELKHVIGIQPALPELGSAETHNRFNTVFLNFLRVFCTKEHPLILFLEDLQWSDVPTLHMIEFIISNPNLRYLFLIISYRNDEITEYHPLTTSLKSIESSSVKVEEIELKPLLFQDVELIVSETLCCSRDRSFPLAAIVFKKALGNPFYLTAYLTELWQQKLIYYNISEGRWDWSLLKIQPVDEDVVEIMINKVLRLPKETQRVLIMASCIGNQFHLKFLSILCGQSLNNTARDLWPALDASLLIQFGEEYKWEEREYTEDEDSECMTFVFLHDRIQQAAYELQERLYGKCYRERLNENNFSD